MRRNRLAASVAGSVLAVAAVVTAVPLLTGPAVPDAPPVAITPATASPSPTTAYALDSAAPWAYRGTPLEELGPGFLDTVTREYAAKRGVAEDAVTLTPLWGQGYDPGALPELAFVAAVDGASRWGIAESGHSGPEFPADESVPPSAVALAGVLTGDGVDELIVLAAPEVGQLVYGPDDRGEFVPMADLADGLGIVQLGQRSASASTGCSTLRAPSCCGRRWRRSPHEQRTPLARSPQRRRRAHAGQRRRLAAAADGVLVLTGRPGLPVLGSRAWPST